jgi:hypothetical protein
MGVLGAIFIIFGLFSLLSTIIKMTPKNEKEAQMQEMFLKHKNKYRIIGAVLLLLGLLIILPKQNETPQNLSKEISEADLKKFIQNVSSNFKEITIWPLYKENATKSYAVDIRIEKDPLFGGANEWNMISSSVFRYSKELLKQPAIYKIHYIFYSPQNQNIDWAHVWVDRDMLPSNWEDLTYHQFFSFIKPDPSHLQSIQWLCEYYEKYSSARPHGMIPDYCRRYNF